jgi:L-ascorbate metabolism protein UlaG (beta-lactamase superfamily)
MTDNIEVFTQSSIRIKNSGRIIYIDPFQMNEEPKNADYILITHDHYDHFSPEDIEKVANSNTILIVPEKMEEKSQEAVKLVGRILTVKPGVYREVEGLEFETVPAYNILKPFHPKSAEWVGYILRLDGKRIYIAGDTDETKEAKAVKCDIALVPIGGTYTMDAKKAAELVNTIRPDVAIPTHYGSIVGKPSDGEVFVQQVKAPTVVELKLKF